MIDWHHPSRPDITILIVYLEMFPLPVKGDFYGIAYYVQEKELLNLVTPTERYWKGLGISPERILVAILAKHVL